MRKLFFIFLLSIAAFSVRAQKFTISGYLGDAETGEKLIGASIYSKQKLLGTTTNAYGFYSLTLPTDTYNLVFSYVGYASQKLKINLVQNEVINL